MERMYEFVSDTAAYGDLTRGPRVIDESTRQRMREVLGEIRTGEFARDWILENQAGLPRHRALMRQRREHAIEQVGRRLRNRMAWLRPRADRAGTSTGEPPDRESSDSEQAA
jgi:ketol-acid reductoisomerase